MIEYWFLILIVSEAIGLLFFLIYWLQGRDRLMLYLALGNSCIGLVGGFSFKSLFETNVETKLLFALLGTFVLVPSLISLLFSGLEATKGRQSFKKFIRFLAIGWFFAFLIHYLFLGIVFEIFYTLFILTCFYQSYLFLNPQSTSRLYLRKVGFLYFLRAIFEVLTAIILLSSGLGVFQSEVILIPTLVDIAIGYYFLSHNFAKQEKLNRWIQKRKRFYFDASPDPILVLNSKGFIIDKNQSALNVFGDNLKDLSLIPIQSILAEEKTVFESLVGLITKKEDFETEIKFVKQNGDIIPCIVRGKSMIDSDSKIWLLTLQDLTEIRFSEALIKYQATHDSITGLVNRNHFLYHLQFELDKDQRFFLGIIYFQNLKNYVSSFNFEFGESLISEMTIRIDQILPEGSLMCRAGNDELLFYSSGMNEEQGNVILHTLEKSFQVPLNIAELNIAMDVCLVGMQSKNNLTSYDHLKALTNVLRIVKESKTQKTLLFTESIQIEESQEEEISKKLPYALKNSEFLVYLQPIVQAATGEIVNAEALIRWKHPEKGLVAPDNFIPLAERTGFVNPMGAFVLEVCCSYLRSWKDNFPDFSIAVNISPTQIPFSLSVSYLSSVLSKYQLKGNDIELEITERSLVNESPLLIEWFEGLAKLKVGVSLDDFGTGYSSLGYLNRFPVKKVKIDKAFIRSIETDSNHRVLVQAIQRMAKSLGMLVTAEGVETKSEFETVRSLGVDLIQGYYFGRPVSIEDFFSTYLKSPGKVS